MAKTFIAQISFSVTVTLSSAAVEFITADLEELQKYVREYYQDDSATPQTFNEKHGIHLGRAEGMLAAYAKGGLEAVYPMVLRQSLNEELQGGFKQSTGDEKIRVSPVKVGLSV